MLVRETEVLRESDETAWTIVDSSASYSVRHPESRMSVESSETVYVQFDFEPELLTGRVYGRSYRYLAKRFGKRGRDVPQDAQADLFVRGRPDEGDGDRASIMRVSRSSQYEPLAGLNSWAKTDEK